MTNPELSDVIDDINRHSNIEHGTYKGYMQCRKSIFGACRACFDAQGAYMKAWRKKQPDKYNSQKEVNRIRGKALRILARRHQKELDEIIKALNKEKETLNDNKTISTP